ncbi:MAG TPA: protein kinase [Thermoanaerobaculia bacterium]|nr:protein kinase [Thermoanaerobaculia bacterium]
MELIGRRFGHIRVTEVVGQGGMGDVYGGYDEKLERRVALKVLNSDQRLDDEARERLLREARALSRLEHPNICRIHDYIETGDVDLLVLEYIDGRTLHDALGEKMPRSEKLRIAVAIAEVLVTAHRAGIVHRDLKPENVMLTRTAEVKVLDFGLARWLTRARGKSSDRLSPARLAVRNTPMPEHTSPMTETMILPPDDSHAASSTGGRRQFLATAVGITLGTPLFMSPEQARGETLTPASDMFSFGLLLQTLFTGEDPHPMGLTAREVLLRVARGETLPVKGAPGDVTALINRLKQFAPADRPTAVEGLERLRLLEQKPQRIARRAIAATLALIAAIGAWRYTVDLKAERAIAVEARAEADARRAQADDLINFMLGDLRKKLEPVGKLDIMDDVAERALAYSGTSRPESLSGSELVQNANALHQLAQVRIAQGKLNEGFNSANHALLLASEAAKRKDAGAEEQMSLAMSHFWVGNIRRLRGEYPEALQQMQRYRDLMVKLAVAHPHNDEYQVERAYGHSAVASILEAQGDLAGALREHAPALAVNRARLAADPSSTAKQLELAYTLNKTGNVMQSLGRLEEAEQHFEQEHAIYARLVAADPRQRKWQDRLANSHSYLASVFELTGNTVEATKHRRAEMMIYGQLHAHDAMNADWTRNYALAMMRVADLLRWNGDLRAAMPLFERSETLLGSLVASDVTRPTWRRDQAVVQIARARAFLAAGSTAQAGRLARTAEATLQQLSLSDPVNRRSLADAQLMAGEVHAASGEAALAAEAWSRSLATIEALGERTTEPRILDVWSRALMRARGPDAAGKVLARLHSYGYAHRDLEALAVRVRGGRG